MGAVDWMMPARSAVLAALKRGPGVAALIPPASMYPGTVPANRTLPYSRFGSMIASPLRATCLDSAAFRLSLQAFSQDIVEDGVVIRTAEDNVIAIGSALKEALDGKALPLSGGMKLSVTWVQTIPSRDPTEASAWMTTATFNAEVTG